MPSSGGNHRVLIVDDEKIIVETLASIFTQRAAMKRESRSQPKKRSKCSLIGSLI
jgi:hypothetical protein